MNISALCAVSLALSNSGPTMRFSRENLVIAPPVAERASPFRHRRILKAFAEGGAQALKARSVGSEQKKGSFDAELLRRFPSIKQLQDFQEKTGAETVILPVLRFKPRDLVDAELWAFARGSVQPVKIASTELHYREALGDQAIVGGTVLDPNTCLVPSSLVTNPVLQSLTKMHPNIVNGGVATGLSPEEAAQDFMRLGNVLVSTARGHFMEPRLGISTTLTRYSFKQPLLASRGQFVLTERLAVSREEVLPRSPQEKELIYPLRR